jgi:probable F420-dependent oxidoreductase
VRLGVTMFATDRAMRIDALARAAEERGFFSLYIPEHTHIPSSRATPPPTGADELPEEYARTLDPFVALMAAAAATTGLRVGTGIALVAQRDPIVTAKEVATLDFLSGGRFTFGIGFGWNREEMADHGTEYAHRRAITRERVLAMRHLWEEDEGSFSGQHVKIEPSWAWPKPVQTPLPVLIGGGGGPKLFEHIVDYADGWIPIGGAGLTRMLPELRGMAAEAGRDPAELRTVPFGTIPDPGKLEHYASLGIDEVVLRIPSAPADPVLRKLDEYAPLVGEIADLAAARPQA